MQHLNNQKKNISCNGARITSCPVIILKNKIQHFSLLLQTQQGTKIKISTEKEETAKGVFGSLHDFSAPLAQQERVLCASQTDHVP
jgi:hypothetical protein